MVVYFNQKATNGNTFLVVVELTVVGRNSYIVAVKDGKVVSKDDVNVVGLDSTVDAGHFRLGVINEETKKGQEGSTEVVTLLLDDIGFSSVI